jgi:hypothetical protein
LGCSATEKEVYLVVDRICMNSESVKLMLTYCSSILLKTPNLYTQSLRQIHGIWSENRIHDLQTKKLET